MPVEQGFCRFPASCWRPDLASEAESSAWCQEPGEGCMGGNTSSDPWCLTGPFLAKVRGVACMLFSLFLKCALMAVGDNARASEASTRRWCSQVESCLTRACYVWWLRDTGCGHLQSLFPGVTPFYICQSYPLLPFLTWNLYYVFAKPTVKWRQKSTLRHIYSSRISRSEVSIQKVQAEVLGSAW